MPYVRKPTRTVRKPYKKRTYTRKPSSRSMYAVAKRVLRANTETKSRIQSFTPNPVVMYHNVPKLIASQLLVTSQGLDSGATSGNRIGNSIQPVGIKLYIQCQQDQPAAGVNMLNGNIWIKVWVLRTHHSNVNISNDFLRYINSNSMMAPVERRTHAVVRSFSLQLKNEFTSWNSSSSIDVTPDFRTKIMYIPMGRIKSYQYENNTTNDGKSYNYCVHACAFSAHPDATTAFNLAKISLNTELFFKDN